MNQISMKKWINIFTFAYRQGPPPHLTVSLTVKYPFFFTPRLNGHKTICVTFKYILGFELLLNSH